jgi:hypothetical protein
MERQLCPGCPSNNYKCGEPATKKPIPRCTDCAADIVSVSLDLFILTYIDDRVDVSRLSVKYVVVVLQTTMNAASVNLHKVNHGARIAQLNLEK